MFRIIITKLKAAGIIKWFQPVKVSGTLLTLRTMFDGIKQLQLAYRFKWTSCDTETKPIKQRL